MKTKHKLKLLKTLSRCSSEFEQLSKLLYLEAIGNPTFTAKIESIEGTKPEPITETFEVGDQVEIIDDNAYHGIPIGFKFEICKITDMKTGVKHLYSGNLLFIPFKDIKKIPTQKDNPKEFKVGDKVRIIKGENITKHFFNDGDIVVINELENDPTHGLCAYCNGDTTNQWVSIKELEHI